MDAAGMTREGKEALMKDWRGLCQGLSAAPCCFLLSAFRSDSDEYPEISFDLNDEEGTEATQTEEEAALHEQYDAALREAKRVIIILHGNAGSRALAFRVEKARLFSAHFAAHVLALDYRGFGDSTGWPTQDGLIADTMLLWRWLKSVSPLNPLQTAMMAAPCKHPFFSRLRFASLFLSFVVCFLQSAVAGEVYIYGSSLGSAVATAMAASISSDADLRGLILEAPFPDLHTAVQYHPTSRIFTLIPAVRRKLLELVGNAWNTTEMITDVRTPVLVMHGAKDGDIPIHLGQAVYAAALRAGLPARFVELPLSDHDNQHRFGDWLEALTDFIDGVDEQGRAANAKSAPAQAPSTTLDAVPEVLGARKYPSFEDRKPQAQAPGAPMPDKASQVAATAEAEEGGAGPDADAPREEL
eukprot:scaffold5328_cov215-Pinguiococcus_pyrenoidosus.AAC.3